MKRSPALGRELPGWVAGTLVVGTFAAVLWREIRRPLRAQHHDKVRRDARNLTMALFSAAAIRLVEKPVVRRLSRRAHERSLGLVPRLSLPPWAEVGLTVALMDYTLYLWHVLTHKVPLLARFHRVHHADLDMDASTALRFHFGEMILSVPWRAAQVRLIGASPRALSLWEALTTAAILFHHSNSRLPLKLERWLCRLVVTPRYHGIHHSIVESETNANWGTILSLPDFLHGTLRLDVPQSAITIGVEELRDEGELTLGKLIPMPAKAA
jgi:sterol desaturase/sphingolipid hydroxylase (fatty acid hydroxylase superfamily)